ncbi:MAG: hypothetical protein QF464_15925, partial [Myxococcota bacterium]|nr:hypothetical protein [Myxococcota bacterium]
MTADAAHDTQRSGASPTYGGTPTRVASPDLHVQLRHTLGYQNQLALVQMKPSEQAGSPADTLARSWCGQILACHGQEGATVPAPPAAVVDEIAAQLGAPAAPETTPVEEGLSMVGEVSYKNERYLPGSGTLTDEERALLDEGADDILVADCSTFATWVLAATGIDVMAETDGGQASLSDYINIDVPMESNSLRGDIVSGADPIQGAAAGFEAHAIGDAVERTEIKPNDFIQTWRHNSGGGHSSIAHRVHCTGAAIFGLPGSPSLLSGGPVEGEGVPMGVDTPVSFLIDERTDPALVGAHQVDL